MRTSYDVIVVGAGPAGSTAARYAAEGGASVLVLEKDRDVGYPVRCGEAVSHEGVVQFIDPDPKWIAATVTKFRLVAPNGRSVVPRLDGIGYVLERRMFDYELARLATRKGAEVVTKAYAYDLSRSPDGVPNGVRVLSENELLAAQGQRVHTGGSDPLNQRFADSFTAHFAALAQKYPVYGELRAIFDLSLAVTLAARTATSAGTLTAQRRPVPSAESTVWWWDARE